MSSTEAAQGRDLSLAMRVGEVCDRFEAAWRAGVPRIEDFLDGWQGEQRLALKAARSTGAGHGGSGASRACPTRSTVAN